MNYLQSLEKWRRMLLPVLFCLFCLPHLAGAAPAVPAIPTGPHDAFNGTPDYYTTANWANSPPLAKFVDALPGLTSGKANTLGQYLSVGKPDTVSYPGSDYYEINLVEFRQRMHSDLPPTTGDTTGTMTGTLQRGYVQVNLGTNTAICGPTALVQPAPDCTSAHNTLVPDPVRSLGPTLVTQRGRPVRIKFTNRLPSGTAGDLFIPTDTSVMGAGVGPAYSVTTRGEVGAPCDSTLPEPNGCAMYTQNRSAIHLHGGRTPWISDGTPHQWITPVEEITPFTKGASFYNVPDMPDPGDGSMTYYYTNQQSARLMFYHEHAWGITRLNPYVGVAAGYLITDKWEQDLITRGIIPPFLDQIPLIIQDKTFVDATPTVKHIYNPASGLFDTPITVPKVRVSDPLWNWGSGTLDTGTGVRPPVTGDLWMPHVYMPAQTSTAGAGGVNPFGRWMYGPWFYPATLISKPPVPNPYYDPRCSSPNPFELADCETPGQPVLIPGTPNVSMGMEAFQDSATVNGTAFPTLTVDPRAYRFRVLNAANDRFWNLSFYKADSTPANVSPVTRLIAGSPDYIPGRSNQTEVKMVPASAQLAADNNWPADWPVDGRDGGVPDPGTCQPGGVNCPNLGPGFLQIGTEGGFLPKPVVINPQPITYNTDPTAFWVGNVNKMGLALGPAERADVIVDFSRYAGQTLILYNDAPAAWPARVAGYDYYTGAPDMRDSGGFGTGGTFNQVTGAWEGGTGPLPGFAPNTRTVMQVIVRPAGSTVDGTYAFDQADLEREFTAAAPAVPGLNDPPRTLFERSQEPIIVGQAAYSEVYPDSYFPTNFPWEGIAQINDSFLKFVTVDGQQVNVPTEPKGIHDEMGASFDPVYGRMSGNLGMQLPNPTTLNALLVLYGYSDVPTEHIPNSTQVNVQVLPGLPGQPGTVTDGTQIWKISHNGVDTHPIHFHIFDVQLINRVGWDGQILLPEPNELGWKDTIKISPLEDTIVAVRPRAPALPFGIPDSLRPLNPAIPIDSTMGFGTPPVGSTWPIPGSTTGSGFSNIDWQTGGPYVFAAGPPPYPYAGYTGVITNVMYNFGWEYVWHCHILSHEEMDMMRPIVLAYAATLPPAFSASAAVDIPGNKVDLTWSDPTPVTYTDPDTFGNPGNEIGFNVYRTTGGTLTRLNDVMLRANVDRAFTHSGGTGSDTYIVEAFNVKGSTLAYVGTPAPVVTVAAPGGPFTSPSPVTLEVAVTGLPAGVTVSQVAYFDGATLLGTAAVTPYSLVWSGAAVGTHSITARVTNILGEVIVSAPIDVTVLGALTADFSTGGGSAFNVCDLIPFTDTSTPAGAITGWSWSINGAVYPVQNVSVTLPQGTYPVTLAVSDGAGATAQVTRTITVANNHLPAAETGGPYTVASGASLALNGSGTDPDSCDTLSYAWDVDGRNGYEFFTANPTISYNALVRILGGGIHTMTLRVTDSNGGVTTATTTVTVEQLAAAAPAGISVPATSTSGSYTVSWTAPAMTGPVTYVLQESATADFATPTVITPAGGTIATSFLVTGKTNGTWYYRVNAIAPAYTVSPWTTGANGAAMIITTIVSPANGAVLSSAEPVSITAVPTIPAGYTVSRVDFRDNGSLIGSDADAEGGYTFSYVNAPVGAHSLTATTYYSNGAVSASAVVTVSVRLPGVALAAPVAADLGTAIPLTATVVDIGVPVWLVEFYDGATLFGYDFSSPYSFQYCPATTGVQIVTAWVYYSNGASETSAIRPVTVNGTVIAPESITVPATSTTGTFSVSWGTSETSGVTYTLQESTDPGFGTYTETLNAGLSKNITGKTNGTYYYRVKAVKNPMQDSDWVSGQCVVTWPVAVAPATFTVPATATTAGTVYLLAGSSPTPGANYFFEYSSNGGSSWIPIAGQNPLVRNPTITLPGPGTYQFRVYVTATANGYTQSSYRNGSGSCLFSSVATAPSTFSVPVSSTGTGTAYVIAGASPTPGANYHFEYSKNGGAWTAFTGLSSTVRNPTLSLPGGGSYQLRVYVTAAGFTASATTNGSNACLYSVQVAAPAYMNIQGTFPEKGQVYLISAPSATVTPGLRYIFEYKEALASSWTALAPSTVRNPWINLPGSGTYSFRVKATDINGIYAPASDYVDAFGTFTY